MTHPANKLRTHNDAARRSKAKPKDGKETPARSRRTQYGARLDKMRRRP